MGKITRRRKQTESFFRGVMYSSVIYINALFVLILAVLIFKSRSIFSKVSLSHLFFSSGWAPLSGEFGFLPFIVGTIEVSLLAMVIAVPICILSAVYLSEYAHSKVQRIIMPVIDVLAGIPSVIYGLFGVIVIVPAVKIFAGWLGVTTTGYSLLSGGIILAIMVFPIIISVSTEVLRAVPLEQREAALALGTTKWEMVKKVVVRSALPGLFAAIVLGFSRAIGETMAVIMVIGNVAIIPKSLFDPAYPLTALIANNYGEMMSIPLYDSALMLAALLLLLIVAVFNISAHLILSRIEKRR